METAPLTIALVCLVGACTSKPPLATPPPVVVDTTDAAAAPAPGPSLAATAPARPATELAVGEAIAIDGTVVGVETNPAHEALSFATYVPKQFLVYAKAEGEAVLTYEDPAGARLTKRFRVVETLCRDTPLHPVVALEKEERAFVDVGGDVQSVEIEPHGLYVASAHQGRKKTQVTVYGQKTGRATVIARRADRTVKIFDVLVGGVCKEKSYALAAPAVPPGNLGPKGDGTCVRRQNDGKTTPAPCPDLSKIDAMPLEDFSPLACDWAAACDVQGHEGCCIGCTNPFPMKLTRPCATRALRLKTCDEVKKTLMAAGCIQ